MAWGSERRFRTEKDQRRGDCDFRMGGDIEIPPVAEMQDSTANKAHRYHNNESEFDVLHSVELEILVLDRAKESILKNEDVRIFMEQAVSQIEGTDEMEELFRAPQNNAQKSERRRKSFIRTNLRGSEIKV